jgi:hypothetical protein
MALPLLPLLRGRSARLAGAGAALLLFAAPVLVAQRLPTNVRPEHYTLHLTPDIDKATFSGDETIDVTLAQAADTITLNAAEIQFQSVTANAGKRQMKADVALDAAKEQATFTFPGTLPAGPVTLKIAYTGILNNELRGFYLSKAEGRRYAVTSRPMRGGLSRHSTSRRIRRHSRSAWSRRRTTW